MYMSILGSLKSTTPLKAPMLKKRQGRLTVASAFYEEGASIVTGGCSQRRSIKGRGRGTVWKFKNFLALIFLHILVNFEMRHMFLPKLILLNIYRPLQLMLHCLSSKIVQIKLLWFVSNKGIN